MRFDLPSTATLAAASILCLALGVPPAFPADRPERGDLAATERARPGGGQDGDELDRDRDDLDRGAGRVAENPPPPPPESLARRILGPPAPAAGESARRSDDGRVTLRAWPLAEPVTVDGVLDDPVYDEVPAAEGFLQQEPVEGAPVSEPTRVWVFYDRDSLYVSADLEQRRDLIIGGEMRRDHRNIGWQDSFSVILDTFYDRRNGFLFHTNEQGGLFDA